jgi:hypothetical protein
MKLAEPKTSNFFAPGPGTYNARYEFSCLASPKWKLGTSTRDDEAKMRLRTSCGPRPDSYNPLFVIVRER